MVDLNEHGFAPRCASRAGSLRMGWRASAAMMNVFRDALASSYPAWPQRFGVSSMAGLQALALIFAGALANTVVNRCEERTPSAAVAAPGTLMID